MKYRIKIITHKNGRQVFLAQFKQGLFWRYIWFDGEASLSIGAYQNSRESALERIDKHYKGNTKIKSITFEYINK